MEVFSSQILHAQRLELGSQVVHVSRLIRSHKPLWWIALQSDNLYYD